MFYCQNMQHKQNWLFQVGYVIWLWNTIQGGKCKIYGVCFRWDREELRFSEKNQKAIDILRMSCLKLKSLVLCDRWGDYWDDIDIEMILILRWYWYWDDIDIVCWCYSKWMVTLCVGRGRRTICNGFSLPENCTQIISLFLLQLFIFSFLTRLPNSQ